jgi:adenylate cyclase class 2
VKRRRVLESNVVYDTPSGALRASGQLLRLRRTGRHALLTYKGPAEPGRYKSREERETSLADAEELAVILTRLGYRPSFRYEKYRTEYQRPGGAGLVLLDETPIGDFFELEGPPEWIDRTAADLGFSLSDYITETYGSLFSQERSAGTDPAAMLFGS